MRILGLAVILLGGVTATVDAAAATPFDKIWAIVNDPLGIQRGSTQLYDTTMRSLLQLQELEGITNAHVEQRLEQIRSIVRDAVSRTNDSIAKAEAAMRSLEDQINRDAMELLYRAQCITEVALMDQARRAFAAYIGDLKEAEPSVTILGIRVIDLKLRQIEIEDPDKAYLTTKAVTLRKLEKAATDDSRAYLILSAYQNLKRGARFTRCHYLDSALAIQFTREMNELELRSIPWVTVVRMRM